MFGLGFSEIVVILIVALLFFGPKKLPEIARTIGLTLGKLQRSIDEMRREFSLSATQLALKEQKQYMQATAENSVESQNTSNENKEAEQPIDD